LESYRGKDNFVENCKLYLLDDDGKDRPLVDEAHQPNEEGYDTNLNLNQV
jgi:hypothetical protein